MEGRVVTGLRQSWRTVTQRLINKVDGLTCHYWEIALYSESFPPGPYRYSPGDAGLYSSLASFFPLVRLLHVPAAFLERTLRIVVGLDGLPVFIDGAFALAGYIENLAQLQVAPNLGPAWVTVAVQRLAVGVRRRLIILLQEKHLGDSVMGERTILVDQERFVEFAQRSRQIALLGQSLSAHQGGPQPDVRGVGQHAVFGIDGDPSRASKGFHRKRRIGAHHINAFLFGFTVGIDS